MHIMSVQNGQEGTGWSRRREIHPPIHFSAPPEFKGELGFWTPEHFLLAAVASCFVATFYAIAAASKMEFVSLQLIVYDNELARAKRILEKTNEGCLIARSLACPVLIEPLVRPAEELLAR
jgi:organic hydroperoxide reductase OsmC/OhrA